MLVCTPLPLAAWKWNWDGIRNKKQAFMVLWQQLFHHKWQEERIDEHSVRY